MLWNKDLFPNWSLAFCAAFFWWHSWGKSRPGGHQGPAYKVAPASSNYKVAPAMLLRTKRHKLCSHLEIEPRAFLSLTGASIHLPPPLWTEQQKFQTSIRVFGSLLGGLKFLYLFSKCFISCNSVHLWFIGTLHWWLTWAIFADMGELLLVVFFCISSGGVFVFLLVVFLVSLSVVAVVCVRYWVGELPCTVRWA